MSTETLKISYNAHMCSKVSSGCFSLGAEKDVSRVITKLHYEICIHSGVLQMPECVQNCLCIYLFPLPPTQTVLVKLVKTLYKISAHVTQVV